MPTGFHPANEASSARRLTYTLDGNAGGILEMVNNIQNLTVVSKDPSDLRAEYRAGFVQGRLQGHTIRSARDNSWDNAYLTDPSHSFPKQRGPTPEELSLAGDILNANYGSFLSYLRDPGNDPAVVHKLQRLLFRLLGIYHGATLAQPAELDFSGAWVPDPGYFQPAELELGYETPWLTFMDVYYINAYCDMMDVVVFSLEGSSRPPDRPDKCSAFLKRTGNDIVLAHNSWTGFLSQSMVMSLFINDDFMTVNAFVPGMIGSSMDFGYNNKGMLFNETTHRVSHGEPKAIGLWMFWRATLAEQFSASLDDFFRYVSLDNTGTYLNGYMLVDCNTGETGLVEMSYRCFVYYRSTGGPYSVTINPGDQNLSTEYDSEMVTPDYLMGINYPASLQVREDLASTDNRPARRRQFKALLPGVTGIDTAKAVITYTDPDNPLSIFGRWDLGYGETSFAKQIPDGAVDAKVATASMVRACMGLEGVLDVHSRNTGFWMLHGTPWLNGSPFVWSHSSWSWQKLRDVPDVLDGSFTLMDLHLR